MVHSLLIHNSPKLVSARRTRTAPAETQAVHVRYRQSVECLFCKIVRGEIPSQVVHQTNLSYAFRDINATAPTHVLIVPKRHIDHAGTVQPEDGATLADMMVTAQVVAESDGIASSGYRLVFNVGDDSGNTVNHLHMHVVGGQPLGWPPFAH
jgi:histidine triad (HIT) family protein